MLSKFLLTMQIIYDTEQTSLKIILCLPQNLLRSIWKKHINIVVDVKRCPHLILILKFNEQEIFSVYVAAFGEAVKLSEKIQSFNHAST